MIREATNEDVPAIVEMGLKFLSQSDYRYLLAENRQQIAETSRFLIANERGVIFVDDNHGLIGMIGMLLYPHHFSGELIAGELVWWVDPMHRGRGVRLVRQAEQWAFGHGARRIQMIAPSREVGRVLERLGYPPIETAHQKTL